MKILVTGAKGFIGKNLVSEFKIRENIQVFEYDNTSSIEDLDFYCKEADFIIHLAGVNRPQVEEEFFSVNVPITQQIIDFLKKYERKTPIIFTSSIQAVLENQYGKSKKACEELLSDFSSEAGNPVYIFRLPNVFGKWCRPNYNSVVATFCHNIANGMDIVIDNPIHELTLIHIDDVVESMLETIFNFNNLESVHWTIREDFKVHKVTLKELSDFLYSYKNIHTSLMIPDLSNEFSKKLYSTFITYLPVDALSYDLVTHEDHRGSFTELFKSESFGQVSINISKPNVLKGNHWHKTKHEKFVVVSGFGVIRFKCIETGSVFEYLVDAKKLQVIDIPSGYAHNIENLGSEDMVTLMWINEIYRSQTADTHYLEV